MKGAPGITTKRNIMFLAFIKDENAKEKDSMCVMTIKTTTPQTSSRVAVIKAERVAAIIQYLLREYTLTSNIAKEKKNDKTPITSKLYSICNNVRFGPQRALIQNR